MLHNEGNQIIGVENQIKQLKYCYTVQKLKINK